jgi:hypothetical protein
MKRIIDDVKWSAARAAVTRDGNEVMVIAEDFMNWRSSSRAIGEGIPPSSDSGSAAR